MPTRGISLSQMINLFDVLKIRHSNCVAGVFDPTITWTGGQTGYWLMSDGSIIPAASGVAISHTLATAGVHLVGLLGVPPSTITEIDCNTDLVTAISPLLSLTALTDITAHTNAGLIMPLSDLPASLTYAHFGNCTLLTGDLSDLPASMITAYFNSCSLLMGALSDLPASLTHASFYNCPLLTGALSDLPASMTYASFYNCPLLTGDSIGHMTGLGTCQIQDCQFIEAEVDAILADMYAERANFTDNTPELNIGGNNEEPSGIYQYSANPLTGKEHIYALVNDDDAEGFKKWAITYTGSP